MTDLPPGWEWTTLGEICTSVTNGIFVSRASTEPDGVPILRISAVRPGNLDLSDLRYSRTEVNDLNRRNALLQKGDLLFTRYSGSRDFVGVCAAVPDVDELTFPDKLVRARLSAHVDPLYVELAIRSPIVRAEVEARHRTTAGQVGISGAALKTIPIPLPPLAEQHRIVAKVEAYNEFLQQASRILDRAEERLSILRLATMRRLTASCPRVKFGDVVTETRYGTSVKCSYSPSGGIPVLRIPNIARGLLDWSDLKYATAAELPNLSSLALEEDDILVVRTNGSRDLIGRSALARGAGGMAYASYIIRCRVQRTEALPEWVNFVLSTTEVRRQIEIRAASSAGQYNLSVDKLLDLEVPLPCVPEQQYLLSKFEDTSVALARGESVIKLISARKSHLVDAVHTAAGRGQLASQDPADEPAAVLLERIRAERAAASRATPARRRSPHRSKP